MATKPDNTLEAALTKCAHDNDLDTIAVGRMPVGDRVVWTATVHWAGTCAQSHSDTSIQDALGKAIEKASSLRAPTPIMPVQLPAFVGEVA
jgi:hypothetical protein